jgi:hypothetical protein
MVEGKLLHCSLIQEGMTLDPCHGVAAPRCAFRVVSPDLAYNKAYITSYLNSQFGSYNHPNRAVEPRIPGIFQYYSIAEDELAKIFARQVDAQTGANNIAAAWEKLTDQIGREQQIALYKASFGT